MRVIHAAVVMLGIMMGAAQAQETSRSMAQLVAEGYEVKATIGAFIILQKGPSAYLCDTGGAVFLVRGAAVAQTFKTAPCWSIAR
jgi:hypothetical protein